MSQPPEPVSGVTADDAVMLVEKLRRIPDDARVFEYDASWCQLRMRLAPGLLTFLTDYGLPHRRRGDRHLYDRHDLTNCAIQLGLGPMSRAVRKFWPTILRRAESGQRSRLGMRYQVTCPAPGHRGDCEYLFMLPGGDQASERVPEGVQPSGPALEVCPDIDWPDLPDEARSLISATDGIEFMMLPEKIRRDVDFLRSSGLADCLGVTTLLTREAAAHGLDARPSFGFIAAPPFAIKHHWAEFRVDDVWVPVDPVLIGTMIRWGVLDSDRWNPYRSFGPVVVRVADGPVFIAIHNGEAVPITLPTRLLSDRRPPVPEPIAAVRRP